MMDDIKKVSYLNEKMNAKASVRKQIRDQAMEFVSKNTGLLLSTNDTFYKQIAIDEITNEPIYMVLDLAITTSDPNTPRVKRAKAIKEQVVIDNLFD